MAYHRDGLSERRQASRRGDEVANRRTRPFLPRLGWLEDRLLLSGAFAALPTLSPGTDSVPLALDSPVSQNLAPFGTVIYAVTSNAGGRLSARFQATGFPARISLVDGQGQPIVQSDGPPPGSKSDAIDVNVPAGTDYLEVRSLGGGGTYQLDAHLTPTLPAFRKVPATFSGAAPIAVVDVNGDGTPDLITPDGVRLGSGNGTFEDPVSQGPLASPDYLVTAITTGYFSGGSLPDIAVLESSSDGSSADVRILRNAGRGAFQLAGAFSVDPLATGIQAIDLGGGTTEIAVANYWTSQVSFYGEDGSGGFSLAAIRDVGTGPVATLAGRFGDGHLDLVVAYQGDPGNGIGPGLSVLQDDGSGQFHLASTIPLTSAPSAIVEGDFGNGSPGLAIANGAANTVSVLLGNGDGTFQYQTPGTYDVGLSPSSIAMATLPNHGNSYLVTSNENSDDVSVLLGKGDGTFFREARYGVGGFPAAVVAVDLNKDAVPDLVVGNLGNNGPGDISLLAGRSDGTFQDRITNPVGTNPVGVVTSDVNHDGHADIISVNQKSDNMSVLLGMGDGTFKPAMSFPAGPQPYALATGDFNGDGRLDAAVTDLGSGEVSILFGNGDGTFQPPTPETTYSVGVNPVSIVAGDFTGSGVVDLAVANQSSRNVSILMGDGHGHFQVSTVPLGDHPGEPNSIAMGNFGGGREDLAVSDLTANGVWILQGNGAGVFHALPMIPLGTGPSSMSYQPIAIASGDFRGKGVDDLAVVSMSSSGPVLVTVLKGVGPDAFQVLTPLPSKTTAFPTSIIAAKLFGDDHVDLAIADSQAGRIGLLKGDGQDGFLAMSPIPLGNGGTPFAVAAGDFTGSGRIDLAVTRDAPNNVAIELNNGHGGFSGPGASGLSPHNTPVVADFNGDGAPDAVIVDGKGDILFREGQANRPGTFGSPVTINAGLPSRDIAALAVAGGTWLASMDANGDGVSLFQDNHGVFRRVGLLPTGLVPAQVVAAGLDGGVPGDLVVRNAGDGTLTIYLGDGTGSFRPPINVATGPGISDVTTGDVNQDGLPDLILANRTAGTVEVMLNRGGASFSQPVVYRAGVGLAAVVGGVGATPLSLTGGEGTVGVVSGALTPGGPVDLVALNAGSETLGVLAGQGDGRFSNPSAALTDGPVSAIRAAYLGRDGRLDLAVLGAKGITIWQRDARGDLVAFGAYDAGPDPTGLTIADVNGDGVPDLVVGNAYGDVLVLQGNGDGTFHSPSAADRNVSLAVVSLKPGGPPSLVLTDQGRDQLVVRSGIQAQAPSTVLADKTSGLLVPGAIVTADLNNDGNPDLVAVNTGGNDVLVFAGLGNGKFGPALNNGQGFPTGTDPVSVTIADVNGDHRPDLIVVDKGSNDVTILYNEPLGNSFTFVQGPRLQAGAGPVDAIYQDLTGDGIPDIVVSDGVGKNLLVIPGRGNGFFDDAHATAFPMAEAPGRIFAGPFGGAGGGTEIAALIPGTGHVTLFSNFASNSPTAADFSSGGFDPVSAFAVMGTSGFEDLVVANRADGRIAFLEGGPQGLTLDAVAQPDGLLNPTAVAMGSVHDNAVDVYAAGENSETASLLMFSLGEGTAGTPATIAGGNGFVIGPPGGGQGLTLLPLRDSSLPLIATLLTPISNENFLNNEEAVGGVQAQSVQVAVVTTTTGNFYGQGSVPYSVDLANQGEGGEDVEGAVPAPALAEPPSSSSWRRASNGLDDAFEEFRRKSQANPLFGEPTDAAENRGRPLPAPERASKPSGDGRVRESRLAIVDDALLALAEGDASFKPIKARVGQDPLLFIGFMGVVGGFLRLPAHRAEGPSKRRPIRAVAPRR